MIPVKVVDASAIGALIYEEPGGEYIEARLNDARLIAPELIDFELTNICITKIRGHAAQRAQLWRGFRLRWRMDIELVDVDYQDVLALAEATGLTGYDASYLSLARQFDTELVTLDRQLAAAAAKYRLQ
ncbi:MAG: type II toxin-antitoxin system VapC family toxin [Pseudomonadota bacterium]